MDDLLALLVSHETKFVDMLLSRQDRVHEMMEAYLDKKAASDEARMGACVAILQARKIPIATRKTDRLAQVHFFLKKTRA